MRIGSLFSGIGGLELGLEWAGVGRTVWQVEQSEYARSVLARHWPDATRHADVFDVGAHNLEPVDVICGGFPCQPVSVAGKREAGADARWLWPEMARIIEEMGPKYVIAENVPGLLSAEGDPVADSYSNRRAWERAGWHHVRQWDVPHLDQRPRRPVRGGAFSAVLADLASLGYAAQWHVFGAVDVGAPHKRNRVFVVAVRRDIADADDNGRGRRHGRHGGDIQDQHGHLSASPRGRRDGRCQSKSGGCARAATDADGYAVAWSSGPTVSPVCRVADGVSAGLDVTEWRNRLRALGNAVVPQCAAIVGQWIVKNG